jgi:enoyl-[acyl-carrier protein] reductase II
VVDAVKVPVVAAGGIGDARGFVAALALGACGIQLGTRLIATPESEASESAKRRILEAAETDTLVTSLLTGKPVRGLGTAALREYESARLAGAPAERQEQLRERFRSESQTRGAEHAYAAGQIAGMIREIRPVADIFEEIITGAAALLGKLATLAAS